MENCTFYGKSAQKSSGRENLGISGKFLPVKFLTFRLSVSGRIKKRNFCGKFFFYSI